jgi:hypothetical protein
MSIFTRCLSCGQDGWATSWLALSNQLTDRQIRAVVVDEQGFVAQSPARPSFPFPSMAVIPRVPLPGYPIG